LGLLGASQAASVSEIQYVPLLLVIYGDVSLARYVGPLGAPYGPQFHQTARPWERLLVSRATARSTITAVLKRIDLKVRFNQTLQQLSVALCAVLGTLLLIEAGPLLLPVPVLPGGLIVAAGSVAFLVFFFRSQLGGRQLERAAGVVDVRAELNDEIKSAYWFMRQDDASPWIDLLVGRAAQTARRLDPRRLVPVAIPRRFGVAFALFVVLQLLALVPSDGPLLTFAAASDSVRFERMQDAYAEEIRDLIDGEGDELLDEEARAALEEALKELEAESTSLEDLLRDLREAQDALDEGNLEMTATSEALDELMEELAGLNELAEFVDALGNQDLDEASDLMRAFAEQLGDLPLADLAQLSDQLQDASMLDEPMIQELLEALEEAADAMAENRLADAQEALERVAAALEEIAGQRARQEANNDASDAAESMQEELAQQAGGSPGQPQGQMAQSQSLAGEPAAASTASPSSEVTRSDGGSPGQQTGPSGNATGDPSDGELELGASTTLESQLALEVIDGTTPDSPEEELDPEDLFQEASRQQSAIVQYREGSPPSEYSQGSALNAERIPWQYRALVKRYFLAIRPPPHRAPQYDYLQDLLDERR
jgi:hypothetical protein